MWLAHAQFLRKRFVPPFAIAGTILITITSIFPTLSCCYLTEKRASEGFFPPTFAHANVIRVQRRLRGRSYRRHCSDTYYLFI
jgi:hypothetical protein